MKPLYISIFFFIASQYVLSQKDIIDISPDGKNRVVYQINNKKDYGRILAASQDVPYGTAPSWSAMRERQCAALAFIDYDLDGDLDLAVGNYYSQSYPPINQYENFIFRNDNGVLDTIPAWVSTDMRNTNDIAWADIDNNGRPDLLSTSGSFQKSVIYFNSSSGLSTSPGWISNDNNWTVGGAFCDIDGDGDLDLAFANQGVSPDPYRPINIFFNDNGNLSTSPNWNSSDQMITNSLAFNDIDKSDLMPSFVSYISDGNSYAFLVPKVPLYKIDSVKVNGQLLQSFCFDELNGWVSIGYIPSAGSSVDIFYTHVIKGDMAAAKWVNFSSGVYFNNNGLMNTLPGWTTGNTLSQKGIAWADIDLDGYKDLAIGGSGNPNVIYKNNSGILSPTPFWQSSGTNTSVQDLKFCDVNNDGYPDLAVVHFGYARVDIFINRGGNLDLTPSWSYSPQVSSTAIAFGDVNGDGWQDLAIGAARKPVMLFLAEPSLIPVELLSFTYELNNNDVSLNWATATEKNNRGFELERRCISSCAEPNENNHLWIKIGFIYGRGTTSQTSFYSFCDKNLTDGKYSYRLKQIDFDGSFKYYALPEIIEINSQKKFELYQNYPNPFNPSTKIRYSIPRSTEYYSVLQKVTLKVYDILGKEVVTLVNEEKPAGTYEVEFNSNRHFGEGGNLTSGVSSKSGYTSSVYFYQLRVGSFVETKKMLLIR